MSAWLEGLTRNQYLAVSAVVVGAAMFVGFCASWWFTG